MRTVWSLETPWAPYSVMFSNDGTRLAIGGGTWYGEGGVVIAELETGAFRCTAAGDLLATIPDQQSAPSIAGVYFSADDRHLAVATRGSGQSHRPSHLLAVEALGLAHRSVIVHRSEGAAVGERRCGGAAAFVARRRAAGRMDPADAGLAAMPGSASDRAVDRGGDQAGRVCSPDLGGARTRVLSLYQPAVRPDHGLSTALYPRRPGPPRHCETATCEQNADRRPPAGAAPYVAAGRDTLAR